MSVTCGQGARGGQGGQRHRQARGGSVSGGNETVLFWGQSPPRRVDLQTIKSDNVPGPFGDHHQRLCGILNVISAGLLLLDWIEDRIQKKEDRRVLTP